MRIQPNRNILLAVGAIFVVFESTSCNRRDLRPVDGHVPFLDGQVPFLEDRYRSIFSVLPASAVPAWECNGRRTHSYAAVHSLHACCEKCSEYTLNSKNKKCNSCQYNEEDLTCDLCTSHKSKAERSVPVSTSGIDAHTADDPLILCVVQLPPQEYVAAHTIAVASTGPWASLDTAPTGDKTGSTIYSGDTSPKIDDETGRKPPTIYKSRYNDSPATVARKFGLNVEDVLRFNRARFPQLRSGSKFPPGTQIFLSAPGLTPKVDGGQSTGHDTRDPGNSQHPTVLRNDPPKPADVLVSQTVSPVVGNGHTRGTHHCVTYTNLNAIFDLEPSRDIWPTTPSAEDCVVRCLPALNGM